MSNKPLTIGALAKAADVNIETIRYYQRIGLITEPDKPIRGYRVYPKETLKRIKFIKRAQKLGFSLQEINDLLQLGEGNCSDVRLQAEQKRTQIDSKINNLQNIRNTLSQLINACNSESNPNHCAIVETLTAL